MVLCLREAMRAIASLGCKRVMRAIASSMSPHISPQQGPTPIFSAATAGGITAVQTVSAAAKTLPVQRPQLVKGKSSQGSRVNVHIEKYLLCFAAQLTSCSSPAATASWLTSSGDRWDLTAFHHPILFRIYLNLREQFRFTSKEPLGNLTRQIGVE